MALLDESDLAYCRATQETAQPQLAQLVRRVPDTPTRTATGGRKTKRAEPDTDPVAIRVDNDPNPPEPMATEFGVHLVRVTAPYGVVVDLGDVFHVSDTEEYRVVSHGDMDAWTTAQRLWAVRVVRAGGTGV